MYTHFDVILPCFSCRKLVRSENLPNALMPWRWQKEEWLKSKTNLMAFNFNSCIDQSREDSVENLFSDLHRSTDVLLFIRWGHIWDQDWSLIVMLHRTTTRRLSTSLFYCFNKSRHEAKQHCCMAKKKALENCDNFQIFFQATWLSRYDETSRRVKSCNL